MNKFEEKLSANLIPVITKAIYLGKRYLAIDDGFMKQSIFKMAKEAATPAERRQVLRTILGAKDPNNLLVTAMAVLYRVTPVGHVYINPWLEDKATAQAMKWLAIELVKMGRLKGTSLEWLIQDLRVLTYEQFELVFDELVDSCSKRDLQLALYVGNQRIANVIDDEAMMKTNDVKSVDLTRKLARINKLLGDIDVDFRDKVTESWIDDYTVYTPVSDEDRIWSHKRGLDLEPEGEAMDPEKEAARIQKLLREYNVTNIGWALARSANAWRCGGQEVEKPYSKALYDLLDTAPTTAMEFFKFLDIEWGSHYCHISPDQQAMWLVIHELVEHYPQQCISQFGVFASWFTNADRCAKYITSYRAEPMYGPKRRAYRTDSDGEWYGEAIIGSLDAMLDKQMARDQNEYEEETGTLYCYGDPDLDDFDF